MERTRVFKIMKHFEISLEKLLEYKRLVTLKASALAKEMEGWTRWESNGRIYVGWKRVNCEPLVNVYGRYRHEPLTAIQIIHRKVRAWLDKRKR